MNGIIAAARGLVEAAVGWRRWHIGPPVGDLAAAVAVSTGVDWSTAAAAIEWDFTDVDTIEVLAMLGPATVRLVAARPTVVVPAGPFVVHLHSVLYRVGVTASWARLTSGPAAKVSIGPLGIMVEPAELWRATDGQDPA